MLWVSWECRVHGEIQKGSMEEVTFQTGTFKQASSLYISTWLLCVSLKKPHLLKNEDEVYLLGQRQPWNFLQQTRWMNHHCHDHCHYGHIKPLFVLLAKCWFHQKWACTLVLNQTEVGGNRINGMSSWYQQQEKLLDSDMLFKILSSPEQILDLINPLHSF